MRLAEGGLMKTLPQDFSRAPLCQPGAAASSGEVARESRDYKNLLMHDVFLLHPSELSCNAGHHGGRRENDTDSSLNSLKSKHSDTMMMIMPDTNHYK
ncbi:hypothetical protein E2C01_025917 [Portunus trituberculatus]|uniref:Uncharacterized protein n=1 Tax=Portunus trituberculatus TaxID=210409 RepID=A0A5B7EH98_PORTR|nr:hypothetical protein [Portunus trituberculatus]